MICLLHGPKRSVSQAVSVVLFIYKCAQRSNWFDTKKQKEKKERHLKKRKEEKQNKRKTQIKRKLEPQMVSGDGPISPR